MPQLRRYRIKLIPEANAAILHELEKQVYSAGGHVIKVGRGAFSADIDPPLVVYLRNHRYVDDVSLFDG